MPLSIGIPGLLIVVFALFLPVLGIAALCWVWMKRSRASQQRFETQNDRIIQLLERQNELLERNPR